MADRIDDSGDLAVAALRRKARRRLVGAIVLALAAATLLPLLLEKEPRSLGDDVSIQIPPVDNGKFVSRLTPDKAKEAASEPKSAVKSGDGSSSVPASQPAPAPTEVPPAAAAGRMPPAPPKAASAEPSTRPITPAPASVADAGARPEVLAPAAPPVAPLPPPAVAPSTPPSAQTPAAPPSSSPPAPVGMPAPTPTDTPQSPPSGASQPVPATTPAAPAKEAASASGKPEGFIIQLAAFTDDKGANSFANKIRKLGYPAYTEPAETSRGKLWRVRVGGYPTRAAAHEALSKLKAEGHDGLVSAAK